MLMSGRMRFALGGFPIEIHWSFFLVAALLGFSNDLRVLIVWSASCWCRCYYTKWVMLS